MKVGIPCMKCSLHPSQTVNSRTGKSSKTSSIRSAWNEMNDERLGRDPTIDKEQTFKNVWMEGNTHDNVEEIVQKEIDRINQIRKDNGKRALRSDAVSVVAIVDKPPIRYMEKLSYEEKVEFLNKSNEVMNKLIHEWNPNWKVIEAVQHHDEFGGLSAHNHRLVMVSTIDDDGLPNMRAKAEFNLKFFNYINKNYPKEMRSLGFDVEDCKTYDQLSEEEKEQRKLHPEEHGVSAYEYKKKQLKKMDEKLEITVKEITQAPNLKSYRSVVEENKSLKEELSIKDKLIQKLQTETDILKQAVQKWKSQFQKLSQQVGNKLLSTFGFKTYDHIPEFPSELFVKGFDDMRGIAQQTNPKMYRIIPDDINLKQFKVVYRYKDGKYENVKGGFVTRLAAQQFVKALQTGMEHVVEESMQHSDGMKRN